MRRLSAKHTAIIDDKGRVVLPAAFKKAMEELANQPVVIEKDIYVGCLNFYPERIWDQKLDEVESKLNHFDEGDLELLEQIYENFTTAKMATNGRINIPLDFLNHAGAKKDVVFTGMGRMIRLWDAARYEERKKTRKSLRDMYKEKLGNNPNG